MRGFKTLIARRRPSMDREMDTGQAATNTAATAIRATQNVLPDDLAARTSRVSPNRDIGQARTVPGREWDEDTAGREAPAARDIQPMPQTGTAANGPADSALNAIAAANATPKIWDLDPTTGSDDVPARRATAMPDLQPEQGVHHQDSADEAVARRPENALSPAPRTGPRPSSDRVKTRLLGFHGDAAGHDMFATAPAKPGASDPQFPIGWLVVVDGPGRGASFTLTAGLSTVGRDPDQTVTLDFGDTSISREGHVAIAYDDEENLPFVGHGGKSNIVRLNGKPLLTTEELSDGDTLRIGKTVLRFVAFCNPEFSWTTPAGSDEPDA